MYSSANIRLALPFFKVLNMKASLKFYLEKLGFIKTIDWAPNGKIELCWLKRDEVSIMLQEPRDREKFEKEGNKGKGISICFQCADALALYKEFQGRGVEIKEPFVGNNM